MSKNIGVCGFIRSSRDQSLILLGRRGKDPNRGLYVLPGGGMESGESLEETFSREVKEETGLTVIAEPNRWLHPTIIELPNRLIFVGEAFIDGTDAPVDGGDLYDVAWFNVNNLPKDLSSLIAPFLKIYLASKPYVPAIYNEFDDPYDYTKPSVW